jgi:hypothetical protein
MSNLGHIRPILDELDYYVHEDHINSALFSFLTTRISMSTNADGKAVADAGNKRMSNNARRPRYRTFCIFFYNRLP